MKEQLITSLTALGIVISPALMRFAEIRSEDAPGITVDDQAEVQCANKDNAPVHERFRGHNDIEARLSEGDLVQVIEARSNWRRIAYISESTADLGWIITKNLTDCPEEPPAPVEPEPEPAAGQKQWADDWPSMQASLAPSSTFSFSTTTKKLHDLYHDHRTTLYCGCPYDADRRVSHEACGYTPKSDSARSHRIEWEHMVPASHFGSFRSCWITGHPNCSEHGRGCCEKSGIDPDFFVMVSDMHNLAPAIGEVNARRSNHPYGETPETDDYGACDFDLVDDVAEPADNVRGDVARAWLYMSRTYGMPLSNAEKELFERWHEDDPPDDWERTRDARIRAIQGNSNPFVVEN